MYGFLLLRTPLEGPLEKKLAGLGVRLLGPHDSHQKARLPVGSVDALAALPEVEWVGVSAPHQKVSAELSALRAPQGKGVAVDPGAEFPIVINLFEGDQSGDFRRQLEAAGAAVGEYDPALFLYRAVASSAAIEKIGALDFVLFIEMIKVTTPGHDQSTPLVDADWIRPGGKLSPAIQWRLDEGWHPRHGCRDHRARRPEQVWMRAQLHDRRRRPVRRSERHGTHVLTTISGTGTANSRFRGVATGVGSTQHIRVGKIWKSNNQGLQSWMESGMDFMANASECGTAAPEVINISGGAGGVGQTGTDSTSRKLDDKVWTNRQTYVVCSGNSGPGSQTIWSRASRRTP